MSDIIQSMNVDGIRSYQNREEIHRSMFQLKLDHEYEYYDENFEDYIPCHICEKDEVSNWGGAFRSRDWDAHEPRDITIRF